MEEYYINDSGKEALLAALGTTAGTISAEAHPEWATPEKVAAWVRALRQGNAQSHTVDYKREVDHGGFG